MEYVKVLQLTEKQLPDADIKSQLDLITVRVFALLKLKQVSQAIQLIANFVPHTDASSSVYRGHEIPMLLQVLSCVVHHLNGDTLRAVNGLYLLLQTHSGAERKMVVWVLARLQKDLGDLEEVERLLSPESEWPERETLLSDNVAEGVTNMAVLSLYKCEHAKAVSILEESLKDKLFLSAAGIATLNLLYGFFKDEVAERKKQIISEVCRFYSTY
jgi:hypothetical protein